MVLQQLKINRNNHVRKKDLSSEYLEQLENRNPELSLLYELIEQYENGENFEGKVPNPYVPNQYIRALLTLKDMKEEKGKEKGEDGEVLEERDYATKASILAKLCDISVKKLNKLKKFDLVKVIGTDSSYNLVISGFGEELLTALNLRAENYSPGFYKYSIGHLQRSTKRRIIPRLLIKHRSVLEQAMGTEFECLLDIYNNPICNPPPEIMNKDLRHIYGVLKQMTGGKEK